MGITNEYESTLKNATVAGPASDEFILSAEEQLSVAFPPAYASFLSRYGAAVGSSLDIAGLFITSGDSPPLWRNIVAATMQHRRVARDNLPSTLLPISDDGCAVTFFIDCKGTSATSSCPVCGYGPGIDGKIVADTFEEFVVRLACRDFDI